MPQYQQHKKGHVRVRVLSKDATQAYLLMMRHSGGRLEALPNNIYVIEDKLLPILAENGIEYEFLDQKK
jgi:hypothetical protein